MPNPIHPRGCCYSFWGKTGKFVSLLREMVWCFLRLSLPHDPIGSQEPVGIAHNFLNSSPCSLSKGSCNLASPILVQLDRGSLNIAGSSSNWEAHQHKGGLPQGLQIMASPSLTIAGDVRSLASQRRGILILPQTHLNSASSKPKG